MNEADFIEKRKTYRLPFEERIIFTDGTRSVTGYAANVSSGGLFIKSLDPFPLETKGMLNIFLPGCPHSICMKSKVVHVAFDRHRAEMDCGMGIQFYDMNDEQNQLIQMFLVKQQESYQFLQKLLNEKLPNWNEIRKITDKMPYLQGIDLVGLQYQVNRICVVFDTYSQLAKTA